jgi:cytochrome c556
VTTHAAKILTAAGAALLLSVCTGRLMGAGAATPHAAGARPPRLLSQTGLYADTATLRVEAGNRPFAPQYPLWSDGAEKHRWIWLPQGATIDVSDLDHWNFPVGTKLWKEFQFGGRRVETRLLWKTGEDHWEFASYAWSDDQREAVLASRDGIANVAEVAPGKWHSIPSEAECRACHDSSRTEVLGFTALQLSDDRDPLAPHAEAATGDHVTLRQLVSERRLQPARPDLVETPPRVQGRDAVERAALGYLSTNCGSCHNRQSTIASLGLFLKYALASGNQCLPDAVATTVGRPGHWVVPTVAPEQSRLVDPGAATTSALLYRMKSRRPASQMPPIGTVVADREAVALLTAWVENRPGDGQAHACSTVRLSTAH